MNFTIKRASNGWILRTPEALYCFGDPEDLDHPERQSFVDMIWHLAEEAGVRGSRYDAERFFCELRSGDKHIGVQEEFYE